MELLTSMFETNDNAEEIEGKDGFLVKLELIKRFHKLTQKGVFDHRDQ